MGGLVIQIRQWWETADRAQRTVAIGGGAFLALVAAFVVMFASRPQMKPAFIGLSLQDQSNVVAELSKDGFSPETNERGDVLVPSGQIQEARMKVAAAGKMPSTTGFGDEALQKLGIMETPEVEKERLKTILEGRLNETLNAADGIGSAQVHIVLADNSPFVRDKRPATASVSVTERAGGSVGRDQARAIATLVANSTPGLAINDVSVINNRMEVLWDGKQMDTGVGAINGKLQAEVSEARRREGELQAMLEPAFGPQAVIAKVNLELDFDETTKDTDTFEPVKVQTTKTSETMTPNSAAATGAPTSAASGNYKMDNSQFTPYPNETQTHVKPVGGSLKSMAIDVIVNSEKVKDTQPVKDIIDGYLGGLGADAGHFTSKVTSVAFDTTASKAASDAASSSAGSQKMQQIISLLPIIALIVVGVVVMKSVGKLSKAPAMAALPGGGTLAITTSAPALPAAAAEAIRMAERNPNDANMQQLARQMTDAGLTEDEAEAQLAAIKGISRKVNVPLEQIKKMSSDRPETVAMLIKGWLLEER